MTILTKTVVPVRRKSLVRRQRLLDSLYQSLDFKLTLITAAAGFGKTSLLVDMATDSELPICWLTLDEDDRDPGQFLSSIVCSVSRRFPGFGATTLSALSSGTPPETAVGVLVNELVTGVSDLFVLILDDYHLADNPAVSRVTDRLLRFLPAHVRILLGGRSLPDIDLIQLTAKQEIAILPPRELCFTTSETITLLEQNHRLVMQEDDAEALTQRMKGWVTGIVLQAQQLAHHPEPQPNGATLDVIYGFLAQEVLELQPPHVRDFLVQTAVLNWMAADICDTLLHRNDAAEVLRGLESRHLFVERVEGDESPRFRYHPLFREFLMERLDAWDGARKRSLLRQAADIYMRRGEREEAIRCYLAIEAAGEATPMIDALAHELFISGRHATLLQWHGTLGKHAGEAPRLQLNVARILSDRGDHAQAAALLETMLENPAAVSVLPSVKVQQGHIWYRQGQIERALAALRPLCQDGVSDRNTAHALRISGLCLVRQGNLLEARDCLSRALSIYVQLGDSFNQGQVLHELPMALTGLGEMDQALSCQAQAVTILRQLGNPAALAMAINNYASTLHVVGQFAEAASLYREAAGIARAGHLARSAAYILLGQADLHREADRPQEALQLFREALSLLEPSDEAWPRAYALVGMAGCHRAKGDLTRACALLDQVGAIADMALKSQSLVERGEVLVALDDRSAGLGCLQQAWDLLSTRRPTSELSIAGLHLAKAHHAVGSDGDALIWLNRAIEATAHGSERDVRLALHARHCRALLSLGERHGIQPAAMRRLRDQIRQVDQACAQLEQHSPALPAPTLQVFALGDGRMIREGREIAAGEWKRAGARLLFYFLVDRQLVHRNELVRQFWPDLPPNKATGQLQSTLYNARKVVGPDRLVFVPDQGCYHVEMSAEAWYDVSEFSQALARALEHPPGSARARWLETAVEIYSGPYLADTDEPWVDERRRELELAYLEALIDLGDCHDHGHEHDQAQRWYRRALELDEYREDVHRRLMSTLAQAGRKAEALRQYDHLVQILRQELGAAPDPVTRALMEQIRVS